MVQIAVQAVTPKPHTETFLKLDLEYKKRVSKKKYGKLRKQHNYNFYMLFISSWPAKSIHAKKRALTPLKYEVIFNYDIFSRWHKVTRMAQS